MEMPFEIREQLNQLEEIVKRIHFEHIEQLRRNVEPYVREIALINSLYPQPLLVTDLQMLGILKETP